MDQEASNSLEISELKILNLKMTISFSSGILLVFLTFLFCFEDEHVVEAGSKVRVRWLGNWYEGEIEGISPQKDLYQVTIVLSVIFNIKITNKTREGGRVTKWSSCDSSHFSNEVHRQVPLCTPEIHSWGRSWILRQQLG